MVVIVYTTVVQCCGTAILVHVADIRVPALVCSQVVGAIVVALSCERVFPNKVWRLARKAEPEPQSLPLTLLVLWST